MCVKTEAMMKEGFGNCSNYYECEAASPKGISVQFIPRVNREFIRAQARRDNRLSGRSSRQVAKIEGLK